MFMDARTIPAGEPASPPATLWAMVSFRWSIIQDYFISDTFTSSGTCAPSINAPTLWLQRMNSGHLEISLLVCFPPFKLIGAVCLADRLIAMENVYISDLFGAPVHPHNVQIRRHMFPSPSMTKVVLFWMVNHTCHTHLPLFVCRPNHWTLT